MEACDGTDIEVISNLAIGYPTSIRYSLPVRRYGPQNDWATNEISYEDREEIVSSRQNVNCDVTKPVDLPAGDEISVIADS